MADGRITLYVAASVDGYVADAEGGVEWLDDYESDDATARYEGFFETVDCLVMGATTYEQVLDFGEWPYGETPAFVLTHRTLPRASDAVEFVAEVPATLAERLTDEYGHVWLVGGAEVARAFLRAGAVDELRLTVVPELLGDGVPLFEAGSDPRDLRHRETTTLGSGLVELWYEVEN